MKCRARLFIILTTQHLFYQIPYLGHIGQLERVHKQVRGILQGQVPQHQPRAPQLSSHNAAQPLHIRLAWAAKR